MCFLEKGLPNSVHPCPSRTVQTLDARPPNLGSRSDPSPEAAGAPGALSRVPPRGGRPDPPMRWDWDGALGALVEGVAGRVGGVGGVGEV